MLLSILDTFFSICSWWMLPFLVIAWALGSWFWNLFQGSKLRDNIVGLEARVSELKSDLSDQIYQNSKLETERKELRTRFNTLELNYKAEQETMSSIKEELATLKEKYLD